MASVKTSGRHRAGAVAESPSSAKPLHACKCSPRRPPSSQVPLLRLLEAEPSIANEMPSYAGTTAKKGVLGKMGRSVGLFKGKVDGGMADEVLAVLCHGLREDVIAVRSSAAKREVRRSTVPPPTFESLPSLHASAHNGAPAPLHRYRSTCPLPHSSRSPRCVSCVERTATGCSRAPCLATRRSAGCPNRLTLRCNLRRTRCNLRRPRCNLRRPRSELGRPAALKATCSRRSRLSYIWKR